MNNIKFNDWQEMALKKDTEEIVKKLKSHESIFFSLSWEFSFAMGAILIDHLFDLEEVDIRIWIICIIVALLPPVIVVLVKLFKYLIAVRNVIGGKYYTKHFVDTFDNQICYWVMMSNSYSRILANMPKENEMERIFLYQEGWYYNNKSIQALYEMKPVVDKVFSNDTNLVIKKNLVAEHRLLSLLKLMSQNQRELDKSVGDIKTNNLIIEQMSINKSIRKSFLDFITDINKFFHTNFNLDNDSQS